MFSIQVLQPAGKGGDGLEWRLYNRVFMIITDDLSKNFDSFWAVDGVNLRVMPGEVLALLGPNGAGKTTTVRMLTSVLRAQPGSGGDCGI